MKYTNDKTGSEKMRKVRGYAIISKGDTPQQTGKNVFMIPCQQGNGNYEVITGGKPTCACPDFQNRQKPRKTQHLNT